MRSHKEARRMDSALCAEVCKVKWLEAQSGGVSTTMKMCIQADLDTTGAIRHMNKNRVEQVGESCVQFASPGPR